MSVHLAGPLTDAETRDRLRGFSGKFYVWNRGIDWCRRVVGSRLRGLLLWLRIGCPETAAEAAEAIRGAAHGSVRALSVALAIACSAPAAAQVIAPATDGEVRRALLADFPACSAGEPGLIYALDGEDATDCETGGGAAEVLCACRDGAYEAVAAGGGVGASALDDLTDVSTAGAEALDALIYDGAGGWSPGIPSIEGATGTAAGGQPITIDGQTYPSIITTDCEVTGDPGDPVSLFCHDGRGYSAVSDEGSLLVERSLVNFIGASITCADNNDLGQTDCTLTDADDQTAAEVPFTPAGGVAATNVQAAIEELDAEDADTASGYGFTGVDTDIVTGTAGGSGDCAEWNADGDLVGSGAECGGGGGGIGGSTGASDNRVLRSDGTGGATLQASALIVDDTGIIQVASGGPHYFQNSSGGFRFYVDDFGLRFGYGGGEFIRAAWPDFQMRSEVHLEWASGSSPTGSKDTGLKRGAAGRVDVTNGSTGTGSILYGAEIASPGARTCADSGDASPGSLVASISGATYLELTSNDALGGCAVVLSETGAVDGQRLEVVLVAASSFPVTFADTAGVQETGAGCTITGQYGTFTARYEGSRWVQIACQAAN